MSPLSPLEPCGMRVEMSVSVTSHLSGTTSFRSFQVVFCLEKTPSGLRVRYGTSGMNHVGGTGTLNVVGLTTLSISVYVWKVG